MRTAIALALLASSAHAQTCGGPVPAFIEGIKAEAQATGIPRQTADQFFHCLLYTSDAADE